MDNKEINDDKQNQIKENQKKDLIIESAIRILDHTNFQNMTTSSIAREAGIAEGTIYKYFKSKKHVFMEVISFVSHKIGEFFIRKIKPDNPLKKNLLILGENFFMHQKEIGLYYKILYKSFSEVDDEEIKDRLSKIYEESIELIYSLLKSSPELKSNHIQKQQVKTVIMMLWGFGDIVWKQMTISGKNMTDEVNIKEVADFVYGMLMGNPDRE